MLIRVDDIVQATRKDKEQGQGPLEESVEKRDICDLRVRSFAVYINVITTNIPYTSKPLPRAPGIKFKLLSTTIVRRLPQMWPISSCGVSILNTLLDSHHRLQQMARLR
jgi:hypothetical protein